MTAAPTAVEPYPPPPGARRSASHRVRVLGREVFVERFAGVSYARFAMRGAVTVEIDVPSPIRSHRVFPGERVAGATAAGATLSIDLPAPEHVVVWIDRLEKLFLLPDPIDDDPPTAGTPGVIDAIAAGADPTGRSTTTAALQAAIDHAANAPGGGTVLVPRGHFRTGTLTLRSGVSLYLAPGALLRGSADPRDYPLDPGRHESAFDESLPPDARFLGRTMTFSRLLLIDRATDVRIAGRGTIDGHGRHLRTRRGIAPNLMRVRESANVSIQDVLFRDGAAWSLHLLASHDISIRNIKLINDRRTLNTDGIDPDMSTDVTIDGSFIYTKDDAICVKATGNSDLTGDPARIVATGNLVSARDAALKVGTESEAATFSDIEFRDNHVFESGRAMSVVVRDGATYERIAFRGTRAGPDVEHLVEQVIGVRDPEAKLGRIRDLTFEDVTAPGWRRPATDWTWYAQFRAGRPGPGTTVDVFEGADDDRAVDGLHLRNIVVNGRRVSDAATARDVAGLTIGRHVRNVRIE